MTFKNDHFEEFGVETIFEDRLYERHEFTVKIEDNEFKGHFHKNEIQWLHPTPRQMIGDEKVDELETSIHQLLREKRIMDPTQNLELNSAFEGKRHERQQFTLQIDGKEYKGFVQDKAIQWFHPHPQHELEKDHIEEIEADIHEKIADQEKK